MSTDTLEVNALSSNHDTHPNERGTGMAILTKHATLRSSARGLLGGRVTRHPERYMEIMRVLRKYDLHHIVAELGLVHKHDEEGGEDSLPGAALHDRHEERHAI